MTLSQAYLLAHDSEFRVLAGFTSPPRAATVTALEASGQVRLALDDADGADVLAWPLNGFVYGVGDVVYVLFAANSPESALVLGAKAPLPTLDAAVFAHDHAAEYVDRDGSTPLLGDWDIGDGRKLSADKVAARDGAGLSLEDDGGNVGVFVKDGGDVAVGHAAPQGRLHAYNGTGGFIFVTKTGVDGTAQTILPNAAGDVGRGLAYLIVITDGSTTSAGSNSIQPGGNNDTTVGTLTLRVTCAADGSLTVKRQSGTGTATVALLGVWL